jgi:hypothetical protein
MFALTRLLLIPAALSLVSSFAIANEIPGAPKDILGTFSGSQEKCQAHFKNVKNGLRDYWNVVIFHEKDGKYTYGDCATACDAEIKSYRVIKNGYILKMKWFDLKNVSEDFYVTRVGGNKLRLRSPGGGPPHDIVRCSETSLRR